MSTRANNTPGGETNVWTATRPKHFAGQTFSVQPFKMFARVRLFRTYPECLYGSAPKTDVCTGGPLFWRIFLQKGLDVQTSKARRMFVRVGLLSFFQPFSSPLHYAKGLNREAKSLPGQTFENVWPAACVAACVGAAKMFVRVGLLQFLLLFHGRSRKKEASRIKFRGFPKKAYPYKHLNPLFSKRLTRTNI